jgi:branched-chain amino acid transport system ATP-binding protein
MNNRPDIVISAQGVTKRFGGITAVNNVSFDLKKNEIAGLIGANGAGKTTFFNVLTGNYIPEKGKIIYKGKDITRISPEQRVDLGIMRSFQLASTFDNLRVIDNLRLAYFRATYKPSLAKIFFSRIDDINADIIEEYLDAFKLKKYAYRLTKNISLGEKRVLEIAMALITEPEVLLLDEPFAGLSEAEIDEVLEVIREHVGKKTILIVEHKISKIRDLVERTGVMVEGEMIAVGETETVLNDARVRKEYWHMEDGVPEC